MTPKESENVYDDLKDITFLTEANRLNSLHFPDLESIDILSVATYLWRVLRVPCSIERHVLEPYFRHIQRHTMANQALARVVDQDGVTEDAINSVRNVGSVLVRSEFVARIPQQFAVRELDRHYWQNTEMLQWRWMLPPHHPAAANQPVIVALQSNTSSGKVELLLNWLPAPVRALFEDNYQAGVDAWENADILTEGDYDGDEEMDGETGM